MDEDVKARLRAAALEEFARAGYDATSAARIAARAGVTERTFFRHFADKREVLFDGEAVLRPALTDALAAAPAGQGPLAALFAAFAAVVPLLEGNRAYSVPRQTVIDASPALREREGAKAAALAAALAAGLRARGIAEPRATLSARAGMAGFVLAVSGWLADPAVPLGERLAAMREELMRLDDR